MSAATPLSALLATVKQQLEQLEAYRDALQANVQRKEAIVARLRGRVVRVREPVDEEEEEDLKDVPPAQRLIVPRDVIPEVFDRRVDEPPVTSVEWCGTSGLKLTLIAGLEPLAQLAHVSFRSGFIRKPSGLAHLAKTLKVLELYENRLRSLEGVECLEELETLDVSYNRLGTMEAQFLAPIGAHLTKLYMAENNLAEISVDALRPMVNLKLLDLGGNNLRLLQGLDTLVNLEEAWLGKNKITKIEGLGALTKLKRLSLQSNRLRKIEGLETLTALEELYLSDQGIAEIQGLDALQRLNTLDLTNNQLTSTKGLPWLPLLTDLWLAANQIASFDDVDRLVPVVPVVETLHLERNPIADDFEYRKYLKRTLPTLHYIDATQCV